MYPIWFRKFWHDSLCGNFHNIERAEFLNHSSRPFSLEILLLFPIISNKRYSPTVNPAIDFLSVCLFTISMNFSSSLICSIAAIFPYWKDLNLAYGLCLSSEPFITSIIFSAVPRYICQTCFGFPLILAISTAYQYICPLINFFLSDGIMY